ncbi:pyridoxamine 5'-phosphate oxidase family protein [Kribbella amoyensis]|uniref:Pyridoxamine 5'-phosphate oxidase family protein n=1 Tax=Kribbella amoyensis TaxID=996641 RepID=A0A561BPV8_9ACTN|nr:PPOX class F420-dependent oxidoreductase [Kribbella amoyensis]TWD80906.1 pyridoxamine 5'-phosphate oxidase family protein [Kribbella amoyensis]
MSFTAAEVEYLQAHRLARFATVGPTGQPDLVPVACEYDGTHFWVGGAGPQVVRTRKFRNLREHPMVALVFDELLSLDPFVAHGIRVYGLADPPITRTGMVGPGTYSRIHPTLSWSWNLDAEPLPPGEVWYPMHRTVH